MTEKPFILITNDDGIDAPGITAVAEEIIKFADIAVVAPLTGQSAVGHAISLSKPLRVHDVSNGSVFRRIAVEGTPADCVKIACRKLLDKQPQIVLSGINLGGNTGVNTIYSGTVAAAAEGTILGIPSIAVSLATFINPDFRYAAKFAHKIAKHVLKDGLPRGTYLNINVPACEESEIAGVSVTRQGRAIFKEQFIKRKDPRGRVYYWLTGQKLDPELSVDIDDGAIQAKMVAVTPVHYDLTQYSFIDSLEKWNLSK